MGDFGFFLWLREQFEELKKQGEKNMSSIQDLDAAIAALTQQQGTISSDIQALITAVNALIARIPPSDFTNEVAAVQAAVAALGASDTAVTTETGTVNQTKP